MQSACVHDGFDSVVEYNTLDLSSLIEAGRIFRQYRDKGVLYNCEMSDSKWQATDEKHNVTLNFDMDAHLYNQHAISWTGCPYETFVDAAKVFILLNIGRFILNTLAAYIRVLSGLIKQPLETLQISQVYYSMVADFLAFLPGKTPEKEAFAESLDCPRSRIVVQSRKLAPFSAYVRFEESMSAFWKSADTAEKIRFFPVRLWWILTVILPLRVTEFLLIPRNCLFVIDGKSFLTVRRTRLKKGSRRVGYTLEEDYGRFSYPVSESLASEIRWYLEQTAKMRQPAIDTLFVPEGESRYVSYPYLSILLRELLDKWEISEHICLGDTRHLALMSLILSGDTPSICKALADHASIVMSMGYYTNMETLSDCRVIRLLYGHTPVSLETGSKAALPVSTGTMFRVKDGYCDYQSAEALDPLECCKSWSIEKGPGDCRACGHFHPDNVHTLIDLKARLREEMEEEFAFLMDSIELLRKGTGKMESIEQMVKRLQSSMLNFLIVEGMHADENKTT